MGRTELNKYVYSLVGLSAVVLVVLVAIIMGMQSYLNRPPPARSAQPAAEQLEAARRAPAGRSSDNIPFPRAAVADWGSFPAAPSYAAPARATLFSLKQQYNKLEFENMAQHFVSVVGNQVNEGEKGISVVSDGADFGAFYMYKPTGSFVYVAENGISLPSEGVTDAQKVGNFLETVWTDDTLQVTGSYEKRSTPGIKYYEVHRDWDKVGLPIINLMGTFNIPEDEKIGTMSLTDNGSDGRARNNDFNTATVGVRDGRIVSVVSNIRPIRVQGSRTYGVIPYTEAVEKLKKNAYTYLYTSPAGEGEANNEMLYPNNSVSLKNITITESLAAYLEDLPTAPQTQLYPYYVFRGTARSGTGYRMNFVAAVPAATADILGTTTTQEVRLFAQGIQNGFNQSQQQGTLHFVDPTDAPLPALSQPPNYTPSPVPTAKPIEQLLCVPPPSPKDLWAKRTDANGYTYGQWIRPTRDDGRPDWYVVTGSGWDVAALEQAAVQIVSTLHSEGDTERLRDLNRAIQEFESASAGCPVRISGSSPSLFIYGEEGEKVVVQSGATITYSDPPMKNNRWIGEGGDYLYYEYAPVRFEKPSRGWTVAKGQLTDLANLISGKLGLTRREAAQLTHELANTARQVDQEHLFVGLIPQNQVDARVPLKLTGQVPVVRYHFYIAGAAGSQNVAAPTLSPIERQARMAVELGATTE